MGRSFSVSIAAASLDRSTNSVRVTPRIAAARSMSDRRSSFKVEYRRHRTLPEAERAPRGQRTPPRPRRHEVVYNSTRRSRRALAMTDSELRVMAALAQMGLMRRPRKG